MHEVLEVKTGRNQPSSHTLLRHQVKGFREVNFPPSGHIEYDIGAVCVCVCVSMEKVLSFLSFPRSEYPEPSEHSETIEVAAD